MTITTKYLELTSDRTLPPLSPSMKFVDSMNLQPIRHSLKRKLVWVEGYDDFSRTMGTVEPHYERKMWEQLPPFDLALMAERIGSFERGGLIASRRFCQLLLDHNAQFHWRPVRLDD